MFSSMKKEEYMKSELSGIFQVNLVAKNIVFGSLGTQRPTQSCFCSMISLFEETYKFSEPNY